MSKWETNMVKRLAEIQLALARRDVEAASALVDRFLDEVLAHEKTLEERRLRAALRPRKPRRS